MAEANDPTDANPEKPETEKPASVAGPTDSPEGKPVAATGEQGAGGPVSADTGDKAATSKAEPEAKPAQLHDFLDNCARQPLSRLLTVRSPD